MYKVKPNIPNTQSNNIDPCTTFLNLNQNSNRIQSISARIMNKHTQPRVILYYLATSKPLKNNNLENHYVGLYKDCIRATTMQGSYKKLS